MRCSAGVTSQVTVVHGNTVSQVAAVTAVAVAAAAAMLLVVVGGCCLPLLVLALGQRRGEALKVDNKSDKLSKNKCR